MDTQELLIGCNTATLKAHRMALLAEAAVVDEILKGRVKPKHRRAPMVPPVDRLNGTAPHDTAPRTIVPA
jgi:hypothetical protein